MSKKQQTIKVILAEDNPAFIEGFKILLLSRTRYELIYIARNGEELINCPILHQADIVLCDIEMPKLNGFEATRHISCQYPDIKVIALSMYTDKLYTNDFIDAGFIAFIYKPELLEQLEITVNKIL
jgi:DNA-binding NarL/FixJ family response regulator